MDLKNNQSGQIIIEAVLLIVLMVGMMTLVVKQLKGMHFVSSLTIDPWARVSGMVECGTWEPCGIAAGGNGKKNYPSNRVVTFQPKRD